MVALAGIVLFIALAAVLLLGIVRRDRHWGETAWPELDAAYWWEDPDDEAGDGPGGVREPRRPLPPDEGAAVAAQREERAA